MGKSNKMRSMKAAAPQACDLSQQFVDRNNWGWINTTQAWGTLNTEQYYNNGAEVDAIVTTKPAACEADTNNDAIDSESTASPDTGSELDGQYVSWGSSHESSLESEPATVIPNVCDVPPPPGLDMMMTASYSPSVGSAGHPFTCAASCKYHFKKAGCKDGSSCVRCHLCEWNRGASKGGADQQKMIPKVSESNGGKQSISLSTSVELSQENTHRARRGNGLSHNMIPKARKANGYKHRMIPQAPLESSENPWDKLSFVQDWASSPMYVSTRDFPRFDVPIYAPGLIGR